MRDGARRQPMISDELNNKPTLTQLLEAALQYASLGWLVFPCWGIVSDESGRGCACPLGAACQSPGKHPITKKGFKEATTNRELILRWWTSHPNANVAVATGSESGLVVIDLDVKNGVDGVDSLKALGPVPQTLTVRTGSGGLHLYYKHPGGTVSNSARKLGPGIDVRGDGGYVIAPPSVHISGGVYFHES